MHNDSINTFSDFLTSFNGYRKKRRMKRNSMAHWINLHQNNIFVYRTRLPLLCEKSGAILLVLVGLAAAWQAGVKRNKGRFQKFWNPLLIALLGILRRFTKVQCYCSVTNVFQSFFWVKHIVRRVVEARKSGTPCFFVSIPIIKCYRT